MAKISMNTYVKNRYDKLKEDAKLKDETVFVEPESQEEDPLTNNPDKIPGVPDGTGPYGRGLGPGLGRADGTGLRRLRNKKS